jgi:glycerol-3-phosphate cytidylyltransferase
MTGPIVGVTFGAFDLLHAGHVIFLQNCRDRCDKLCIGVHSDPSNERSTKNKPVQTIFERTLQLKACRHVDEVFPYDTERDLENFLKSFTVDVRFLDERYEGTNYTGREACEKLGIRVEFIPRKHDWSSSSLRRRVIFARWPT